MRKKRNKRGNGAGAFLKYIVLVVAGGSLAISLGFYTAKYLILPRLTDKTASSEIVIEKPSDNSSNQNSTNVSVKNDKPKPSTDNNSGSNTTTPPATNDNQQTTTTPPSTNTPSVSTEKGKYTIKLPSINVYNVQVGSFDNQLHANNMVAELHKKNLGGFVVATDRYRVSTLAVDSRDAANTYKNFIRETYSDAFIAVVNVPEREVNYNEGNTEINNGINKAVVEVNSYLKRLSSFVSNDLNTASKADIDKYIDKELVVLENLQTGLALVTPSDPKLAKLHKNVKAILDDSISKFKSVKASSSKDVATIHDILLIGMNGYALVNN